MVSLSMGLSSCTASCLAEQTALSDLLLDCTMTRANALFRIVFIVVCVRVLCICIL